MLAEVEKGCTFAPAITAKFLRFSGCRKEGKEIKFFFRKSLPETKKRITFAPRTSGSSLGVCAGWEKNEGIKISEKKLSQKLAGIEKDFYFCTRFLRHGNGNKKE